MIRTAIRLVLAALTVIVLSDLIRALTPHRPFVETPFGVLEKCTG